jgi:NMD protein affecting ribosome stability and mRNA decay
MASESIGSSAVDTCFVTRKPELLIVHDEYDYPANARCSSCGKAMPLRQSWITSSTDNLIWFAEQFRLHVETEHPDWIESLNSPGQLRNSEAA